VSKAQGQYQQPARLEVTRDELKVVTNQDMRYPGFAAGLSVVQVRFWGPVTVCGKRIVVGRPVPPMVPL
jgi:hypothetical protein